MSDLQRRSPSHVSRRTREQRAYRLVLGSGVLGVVAVVGIVLAIAGVIGATVPVLAAILAVVCFVMFRRAVGS
jgi:hypothetical protein